MTSRGPESTGETMVMNRTEETEDNLERKEDRMAMNRTENSDRTSRSTKGISQGDSTTTMASHTRRAGLRVSIDLNT